MAAIAESSSSTETELSVRLRVENPYRPITLGTMFRLYAHYFIALLDDLRTIENRLDLGVPGTVANDLGEFIGRIHRDCQGLGLVCAQRQIAHIIRTLQHYASTSQFVPFDKIRPLVTDLRRWINEDLEGAVFYQIEPAKVIQFFKLKANEDNLERQDLESRLPAELFDSATVKSFGSATKEIEEAAKCYVCGRHTASVFHLMRIMEIGLRVLGVSLNDPALNPIKNRSWETILKKCDGQLSKPFTQQCQEWQSDPTFFAGATANLRAVKDAWRNPTMHVDLDYDEEKAIDVWNAVRAFMRHLSTKLHE